MKTKVILCILAVAVVTLSFTFASVNRPLETKSVNTSTAATVASQPVGGLYADDEVK